MSQIIRYIDENNEICESFIDFVTVVDKTGEGLAQKILDKLEENELDIENCGGTSIRQWR